MARHQISLGQLDEARRTVGEVVLVLDEVNDDQTLARASTMLAEALLGLDSPKHAKPRLQRAIAIFDRLNGDGRWGVRARIALGRALVMLDDITGIDVLLEAREACVALKEQAAVAHIDAELREAEKTFDTPRHVHTGYGRPVSVAPPPRPF
jgi:hypothetical protein